MKKLFIAVIMVFIASVGQGQDSTVQMFGRIFDQNNRPIENVLIELKSTKFHTKSNGEGHYFFMLPAKKGIIVYSCRGYQTKEIGFTGTPQANDLILAEVKKKSR